jgi:hypothetical protein
VREGVRVKSLRLSVMWCAVGCAVGLTPLLLVEGVNRKLGVSDRWGQGGSGVMWAVLHTEGPHPAARHFSQVNLADADAIVELAGT